MPSRSWRNTRQPNVRGKESLAHLQFSGHHYNKKANHAWYYAIIKKIMSVRLQSTTQQTPRPTSNVTSRTGTPAMLSHCAESLKWCGKSSTERRYCDTGMFLSHIIEKVSLVNEMLCCCRDDMRPRTTP